MTAADLIFWYTGAGAWGIVAILFVIAVLVGLIASAGWAYRYGRKYANQKLCIAKLRDMDLTNSDVVYAFRSVKWPDNFDNVLDKIAKVQHELRDLTCDNWKRRDLLAKLPIQLAADQQEKIRQLFREGNLNELLDSVERDKLVKDILAIAAGPKEDN